MTLDSENHQLKKPAELVDFKNDPVDEWTFELIREMNTHNYQISIIQFIEENI